MEVDAGVEVGAGSGDTVVSIITGNPGSAATGASVAGASVAAGGSVAAAPPHDVNRKHRIKIKMTRRITRTHFRLSTNPCQSARIIIGFAKIREDRWIHFRIHAGQQADSVSSD